MLGPTFHGYHWGSWTQCVKDLHVYMARITDMCGCVHLCVCMWVCVCASLCVHVCICGNVYVCMPVNVHVDFCMHVGNRCVSHVTCLHWHDTGGMSTGTQSTCLLLTNQHVHTGRQRCDVQCRESGTNSCICMWVLTCSYCVACYHFWCFLLYCGHPTFAWLLLQWRFCVCTICCCQAEEVRFLHKTLSHLLLGCHFTAEPTPGSSRPHSCDSPTSLYLCLQACL